MKFNRLLPILAWVLVISCIFFESESASPTPPAESTAPPSATESVTEVVKEETTEEDAAPELSRVLPAPIYFLTGEVGNASLWRVEMDGATLSPIKECCIREYAVSPASGQIAYVTDDIKLFITDADGQDPIEVDLNEVRYPQDLDTALAWSPDGLQLALGGENGLWVYLLESGRLVQISGTAEFTTFIRPLAYDAWSPNGSEILIAAHRPNADVDEIGMIPIVSGEVKMASILTGRRATWAPDGESFFISSNFYGGMGALPSLIVVNTDELEPTALVDSLFSEGRFGRYLEGAQVGQDDLLYYFYGEGPIDLETKTTELSMYRSNRDGITDRASLRTDTFVGIREILWAEDMSLAVITIAVDPSNNQTGVITILPADGEMPVVSTAFEGYGLQWGQNYQDIEEYAVYNDLLEDRFKGADIDQILIIDRTDVNHPKLLEQDLAAFQENTPLSPELVASFKERNQQSYLIKPVLDFGVDYQLLSQEKVDEMRPLDEASGWKLLYEKYPNSYGFLYLSRVGFNRDFSQALVYTSTFHYERGLEGGYYLMVKVDGGWEVESSYAWNS